MTDIDIDPYFLKGNIQRGVEASSILNLSIIEEQAKNPFLHSIFNSLKKTKTRTSPFG